MNKRYSSFRALAVLVANISVVHLSPAHADNWSLGGYAAFDRAVSDDETERSVGQRNLQPRFMTGISADRSFHVGLGRTVQLSFGADRAFYPDNHSNDRLLLRSSLDYVIRMREGLVRQLQFSAEFTHALDPRSTVFSRVRLGAAVRFEPAPRQSLQLRVRLGYREQNDANTFSGFDQSELLTDLTWQWASEDRTWRGLATAWMERREAEADRFSYMEFGARVVGRWRLSETAELNTRLSALHRDYDEGGRVDRSFRGTVGLLHVLTPEATLEAYLGYHRNESTFPAKAFEGGIFGLEFRRAF